MANPWLHNLGRRRFLGLSGAVIAASQAPRLVFGAPRASATTIVYASSYGWNSTNNTTALQDALDSGADVVVIDLVNKQSTTTWLTGPLVVNNNNFTIIVESGVTVQSIAGFTEYQCLMSMTGRTGITLQGYGATFAMNKSEYTTGEFRHALVVSSCTNIWIEGLTLRDSGGDGLTINPDAGADRGSYPQYCTNVTVKNVTCDNNRRNGTSPESVDGLTIQGCAFINSNGTSPEAGMDFEPNNPATYPNQRVSNVTVTDTLISGNHQEGLDIPLWGMRGLATPVTITLERVHITGNGGWAGIVVGGAGTSDPGGLVKMSDSLIATNQNSACARIEHKSATGMAVEFTDTVYWDEPTKAGTINPITVGPVFSTSNLEDPVPDYGGITWTNVSLITNQPPPFLSVFEDSEAPQGVSGLDGNITVADPNGVSESLGAHPHDNTLAVTALTAAPATTVGVTANTPSIAVGGAGTFTFTRTGDTSAPLAIVYTVTRTNAALVDGLPGCVVIPAGQLHNSIRVTSVAAAYSSGIATGSGSGTVTLSIGQAPFSYAIGPNSAASMTIG